MAYQSKKPVSIIMGSQSDYTTMRYSEVILDELEIGYETLIVSAHRTPERLYHYAKNAANRGIKVIIAGAGGAAHLPGMVASLTTLPVLGVPISSNISGIDSLLSIIQMPSGTPVATFSIGESGAKNASLFAARILAITDDSVQQKLQNWIKAQENSVAIVPQTSKQS